MDRLVLTSQCHTRRPGCRSQQGLERLLGAAAAWGPPAGTPPTRPGGSRRPHGCVVEGVIQVGAAVIKGVGKRSSSPVGTPASRPAGCETRSPHVVISWRLVCFLPGRWTAGGTPGGGVPAASPRPGA